ncbi:hypothetical protein C0993_012694 [Termitomyces sp. T159_Od127]|nr:hypothetical protein C0993_012694 [Termitomyces sp. T159_Od127]
MPARPSKHARTPFTPIPHDDDLQRGDLHDDVPPIPIPMPPSQMPHPPGPDPFVYPAPSPVPAQHARSASGLARTIPATSKRFTPTPSPAVPVVDLGTASVAHRVEGEEVLWGRWDRVSWTDAPATRLLFVAYPSALRVWDTTDLDSVGEVLRLCLSTLEGAEEARIVHAAVLPAARRRDEDEDRPWIGIATTAPAAIHVLSATTFSQLASIPRARLALYTPPPAAPTPSMHASATAVLTSAFAGALGSLRHTNNDEDPETSAPDPEPARPIYALSRRLLAYVSTSPRSRTPHSTRQAPPVGVGVGEQSPTAAAAQSVWAGVRTLGGLAVSAARSRMRRGGADAGAGPGRFFSRSAPEREVRGGGERERAGETEVESSGDAEGDGVYVVVVDLEPLLRGAHAGDGALGDVVCEVRVDTARGVSKLAFGRDGCTLDVVGKDGTRVGVYALRPCPRVPGSGSSSGSGPSLGSGPGSSSNSGSGLDAGAGTAWSMYTLRRGRTGAVVESVGGSADGRWLALATRKRTVHVFALNPYGGPPDVKSHWEGRVRNGEDLQTTKMYEVGPLVRLRAGAAASVGAGAGAGPPLAFTFVEGDPGIPNHLLPSPAPALPFPFPHPSPHSTSGSGSSSVSPARATPRSYSSQHHSDAGAGAGTGASPPPEQRKPRKRGEGYQDLLVFEPREVVVVLRRVGLEVRPREAGIGIAIGIGGVGMGMGMSLPSVGGTTSVSFPGSGGGGGVGSPSSVGMVGQRGGQYQQGREVQRDQRDVQVELAARESVVMTWNLRAWGAGGKRVVRPMRRERVGGGGRAEYVCFLFPRV